MSDQREYDYTHISLLADIENIHGLSGTTRIIVCKICKERMNNPEPFIQSGIWCHFERHAKETRRGSIIYRKIFVDNNLLYEINTSYPPFSFSVNQIMYFPLISYEIEGLTDIPDQPECICWRGCKGELKNIGDCDLTQFEYYKYAQLDKVILGYIRENMIDNEYEIEGLKLLNTDQDFSTDFAIYAMCLTEEFIIKYGKLFCVFCRKQYTSFPTKEIYVMHMTECEGLIIN